MPDPWQGHWDWLCWHVAAPPVRCAALQARLPKRPASAALAQTGPHQHTGLSHPMAVFVSRGSTDTISVAGHWGTISCSQPRLAGTADQRPTDRHPTSSLHQHSECPGPPFLPLPTPCMTAVWPRGYRGPGGLPPQQLLWRWVLPAYVQPALAPPSCPLRCRCTRCLPGWFQ